MYALTQLEAVQEARIRNTCNFDQIVEPGTYVEVRWGVLFRMPADALPPKRRFGSRRVHREQWPVTQLSRDPDLPVGKARSLAAELGLEVRV
jgi:hypothetical protein